MFHPFQPIVLVIGIILGLFTHGVVTNRIPDRTQLGCIGLSTILTFPATIFCVLLSLLTWPFALLGAIVGSLVVLAKWSYEHEREVIRRYYR